MNIYINNIFKKSKEKNINDKEKNDTIVKELNNGIRNKDKLVYEVERKIENKVGNQNKSVQTNYIRKGAKNNINEKKYLKTCNKCSEEKNEDTPLYNRKRLPKSYYFLLIFMIGLATLSLKMVIDENKIQMQEDYAVFNSNDNNANDNNANANDNDNPNMNEINVLNQDESSTNIDTRKEYENIINNVEKKLEESVKANEVEKLKFIKPLDGEISKIYSDDKLIYSKTLEMWKTHDGIDIKCDIGSPVFSIEKGYVEKIYDDAFYGVTVVINHGQGYKSSYSNLNEETKIHKGENIKKGQKIGIVGTTSIGEIKDNPHLHFTLYQDDEIVDPSSIFN